MAQTKRLMPKHVGLDFADPPAPDQPVAFLFGLPMMGREAYAFSNIEAGHANEEDREVMRAWKTKMVLIHGSWVSDTALFE